MADISIDETRMKALLKAAIIKAIEENQEFVRDVLEEALEGIAMSYAIDKGEQTPLVSRDEVFKCTLGRVMNVELRESFLKHLRSIKDKTIQKIGINKRYFMVCICEK